ncbi:polyprenyl synthetase family protein [Ruminococcus flavefaciens]|uniref:polyprenyl synthetase family protein n=1 Tax=Ruminococcus flavefaciens TaxID=1265 RepID=UPI0026EABB17|nr:farnesyl diphosphate synthase [Ruminococcus flavefaciens]MDD7517166.1 polyprenyl synthetase family protein [Ruminococcus flavefaciens]MDY5690082.1 farnesyl diphosphate synthase [Ruminococcus flavefaciens]
MTDFKEKLNEYIKFTEENLSNYNQHSDDMKAQKNLIDAMNYSLEAGGKRIRPVLVYSFCNALGGDYKKAAAPAAAIEMIHTFSLIHDDLPAMDDDDFRRGKPSCHKAFGEAMAILAGDALSVQPFEIIANDTSLTSEQKVKIISCLAKAVGREGMIGGQVIDMENEERSDVDEANLRNMYRHKTGQLIAVSCMMGCICAGADDAKIQAAADYGFKLGLAFQIIDDILDVTSTTEELGKPVGSDAEENKTTFVTLYGVEKAGETANTITEEALSCLAEFKNDAFLTELTEMLLKRKN